jgi:hypothetical protein
MSVNFIDLTLTDGSPAHINVAQIQMVRAVKQSEDAVARACVGLAGDPDVLYVMETLEAVKNRINIWSE